MPTHSTDARIVLTLVGGDEAKIYGSPEAAGRCMAEYEHHAVLLRGSDGALPRQDQTAAASTASKKRRDRRRKKQAETEKDKETREAQAAQATNLARSEDDDDEDDDNEADSERRAIATPSGSQLWSEDEGVEDDRSLTAAVHTWMKALRVKARRKRRVWSTRWGCPRGGRRHSALTS